MKRIFNILSSDKNNDVLISTFQIVRPNNEFRTVFHNSMHFFSDCLNKKFNEVREDLGNKLEIYQKLETDGIVLLTEQNKNNEFEVHYWQNQITEKDIIEIFDQIGFKIELVPD